MGPAAPKLSTICQAIAAAMPILCYRCFEEIPDIAQEDWTNAVDFYPLSRRGTETVPFASSELPRAAFAVTQFPILPFDETDCRLHHHRSDFQDAFDIMRYTAGRLIMHTALATHHFNLGGQPCIYYAFLVYKKGD